jgi:acyl carrier protein
MAAAGNLSLLNWSTASDRVDRERVTPAASFLEGLAAYSLDIVELVMQLEEAFGATLSDEKAGRIEAVDDAIDYLARWNP